jgi:hypothetical protein
LSRLEALVMAIMRAWIPLAVLGAVIVGCTPDASVNEAYQGCTVDSECGDGGLVCRRGFCVVDLELTPGACLVGDGVVLNGDRTDCYTGPEGTLDVGRCRAGEQECFNGELTSCLGEVLPRVEMCNGRDDNCDGVVDNLEEVACDTGMLGRCMEGRLMCRGSLAACEPVHEPRKEECNGLDDDCDGVVDNDVSMPCYPQGESGCVEQADGSFDCMGLCQPGTYECNDGEIVGTCSGHVTPEDETLETCGDGLDQSCSGTPDEGCGCTGAETQPCYTGPSATRGIGACHDGVQTCDGGSFGPCVGDQTPVPETCANMDPSWEPGADPATLGVQYDNDCNGIVDDVPNLGEQCIDDAAQGVCRRGTWWCDMEQPAGSRVIECNTPEPLEEDICDGTDRNCDGTVDTGFDLLNDNDNCGECGNECNAGLQCCQGACMNLQTSEDACGTCDTQCGEGRSCCSGGCVDTQTSTSHCGGCGEACMQGETCSGGLCCGANQTNCGGTCVNTQTNTSHCGSCGRTCEPGETCRDGCCCRGQSCTC